MEAAFISRSKGRFFMLDLLLCSLWALFVLRLWTSFIMTDSCVDYPYFDWWTAPIVGYFVVLRLGISFLMLHEDRNGLLVSLVLLLGSVVSFLLSRFVLMDAIRDVFNYFNLACGGWFNPDIRRFEYLFSVDSYNQVVDATWGVFLFCWVWLMPLVYFLIHRKEHTSTSYSLTTALSGLYQFKDSIGKKYLYVCALFLSALIIGMMMVSVLSLVVLFAVSYLFFRMVAKWANRTIKGYEWFYMVFATVGVWLAQYQYGVVRIVLLLVSVLLSSLLIFKISKVPIFKLLAMIVIAGMILPSLCMGYNVFALTDCKRLEMLHAQYNLTGVFKVQDSQGRMGLRDRYRMIIPAQYSEIEDYHLPYLMVKKGSLWGIWNTQYTGFVKGDYDYVILGVDRSSSNYEDLCFSGVTRIRISCTVRG